MAPGPRSPARPSTSPRPGARLSLHYLQTTCRLVLRAFTGTDLDGTHRRPAEVLLILLCFSHGVPLVRQTRELGCGRMHLLEFHRIQVHTTRRLDRNSLGNVVVEADEKY